MRDRDEMPRIEPADPATSPLDWTGHDGAAGMGDILSGMSTGAGGRLGPDNENTTCPMPANQHSFADVELPIDTDTDTAPATLTRAIRRNG